MEHIEAVGDGGNEEVRPSAPPPPIWIFSLLVLSPAVYSNGFVSTVMSSLLRSEHMSLGDIANVTALMTIPQTIYFFWSPMVDFWVRRRTWVAVAGALAGLLLGTALQFPVLGAPGPKFMLFLAACVVLLAHAAVGGLMAALVPPELKARAGGFYQMGNCGLAALAGGAMLYCSAHLARREFGIVSGLMVGLPGLVALTIREPEVVGQGDGFGMVLRRIRSEFKDTFFQWKAVPVLLVLAAPFGSGAALGLLPSLAPDYGVSVDQVAWMNGLGGGLLTALGALLIGFLKMPGDLRPLYAWMGLINAATLGILLVGSPRPVTYFVSVTLYMISVGACYALFTAVVLKLLGFSGKSGGSRYAIALSIDNLPIFYMTIVDGMGARWFGTKGEPGIDMAVSAVGALLALAWFWWERRRDSLGGAAVDSVLT
jgi:PAT family beta-lactamase induction signal transducer AmpG